MLLCYVLYMYICTFFSFLLWFSLFVKYHFVTLGLIQHVNCCYIKYTSIWFDIEFAPLSFAALALQVLVLLDVNPEESMLDEGLAREVVNRIQKLRKKVTLHCILLLSGAVKISSTATEREEKHKILKGSIMHD